MTELPPSWSSWHAAVMERYLPPFFLVISWFRVRVRSQKPSLDWGDRSASRGLAKQPWQSKCAPWNPCHKSGVVVGICNCCVGEAETRECWRVPWAPSLAKWAVFTAVRDPVSTNKVNDSWGVTGTHTHTCTHTHSHTPIHLCTYTQHTQKCSLQCLWNRLGTNPFAPVALMFTLSRSYSPSDYVNPV